MCRKRGCIGLDPVILFTDVLLDTFIGIPRIFERQYWPGASSCFSMESLVGFERILGGV